MICRNCRRPSSPSSLAGSNAGNCPKVHLKGRRPLRRLKIAIARSAEDGSLHSDVLKPLCTPSSSQLCSWLTNDRLTGSEVSCSHSSFPSPPSRKYAESALAEVVLRGAALHELERPRVLAQRGQPVEPRGEPLEQRARGQRGLATKDTIE